MQALRVPSLGAARAYHWTPLPGGKLENLGITRDHILLKLVVAPHELLPMESLCTKMELPVFAEYRLGEDKKRSYVNGSTVEGLRFLLKKKKIVNKLSTSFPPRKKYSKYRCLPRQTR
jgi:hypothetical protein